MSYTISRVVMVSISYQYQCIISHHSEGVFCRMLAKLLSMFVQFAALSIRILTGSEEAEEVAAVQ